MPDNGDPVIRAQEAEYLVEKILSSCVKQENGCLLWLGAKIHNGYGHLRYRNHYYLTHRLIAVKGDRCEYKDDPREAMHSCDVRACCEFNHLSMGTRVDNMQDAIIKGRFDARNKAKRTLSDEQALQVKRLLKNRLSYSDVGRVLGIDRRTVRGIAVLNTYNHVQLVEA